VSYGVGVERVVRIAAKRLCSVSRNATTHCSIQTKENIRIFSRFVFLRLDAELLSKFRTGKQFVGKSVILPLPLNGPLSYLIHGKADIFEMRI